MIKGRIGLMIGETTPKGAFSALVGAKYNTPGFGFTSPSFRSALSGNPAFENSDFQNGSANYLRSHKTVTKPITSVVLESFPDSVLINLAPDLFIAKYSNMHFLTNAVYNNPKILATLAAHGLSPNIKQEHITKIVNTHLIPTMLYARKIVEHSGENFGPQATEVLLKAALLHDIGKVLIPTEIINKKGALTPQERKIIDLHSELGAEILKSSNLEPELIELVANHHRHLNNVKKPDKLTQILTIADIYSALREKRAYKDKMENGEIFEIFHDSINNGELERKYFVALKEYVIGKRVSKAPVNVPQEALA